METYHLFSKAILRSIEDGLIQDSAGHLKLTRKWNPLCGYRCTTFPRLLSSDLEIGEKAVRTIHPTGHQLELPDHLRILL